MYKGKISVWINLIIVVLIFQFSKNILFPFVNDLAKVNEITFYADVEKDDNLLNRLSNKGINNYSWIPDKQNPDILITDNKETKTLEGYIKYENFFYSPLVFYMRSAATNDSHNSGFIKLSPEDGTDSPLQIDLYTILEGMENNKEWKDIGISTKVAKGPINITIPNERSPYYDKVVDLFYLTLNNNKIPTDKEKIELETRVNNLLNKCEKAVDISQSLIAEYKTPSTGYKVFIGPEYLLVRSGNEINRNNNDAFTVAYFINTTFVEANLYLKETFNEDRDIIHEEILEYLETSINFYDVCGWRIKDSFLRMKSISYSLVDKVPGY